MSTAEVVASVQTEEKAKDNNNANEDEQLPKHWTKVASKKHSGKFYYFNVATKESLWEHPGKTRALEKEKDIIRNIALKKSSKEKTQSSAVLKSEKVIQLKNDTQFKQRKNLAKERLDKLQKQLGDERKMESEKEKSRKEAKTSGSPRNKIASKSPVKRKDTTPPRLKRKDAAVSDESATKKIKSSEISSTSKAIAKKTPPKVTNSRLKKDEQVKQVLKTTKTTKNGIVAVSQKVNKELKSFKIPKKIQEPVTSSIFVDIKKMRETKPDEKIRLKSDLETVPEKEVASEESSCVSKDTTLKISYAQKLMEALVQRSSPARLPQLPLKPAVATISIAISSPKSLDTKKQFEHTLHTPSPKISSQKGPTLTSTPKVQTIIQSELSSVKSPANERLAGIREKLAQEITQQSVLLDEDAEMTDLSDYHQNNSTAAEAAPEAMDWEDIPEEVALREVVTIRQLSNGLTISNSNGSVLDATIPEYGVHLFDQINFPRFVFIVMDTNVFLSHLKGVGQLLGKGFPHIGQPILIIPYIVLQELDRIKHREQGKPLSQAASQSIRFINEHLKRRDPRIKGQSTIEATVHLVPVENPDDHIINCCFQVRQIIAGRPGTELMLLSNDVNLRNKALVNGLPAFGYGELMAEADRIRFATDDVQGKDGVR